MNLYLSILETEFPWLLFTLVAIIGLAIGSFLNVVIYRLPLILEKNWRNEARHILDLEDENRDTGQKRYNLATPGSTCPACGHAIKWFENIPVISWLLLKGRCSNCQTRISLRYPLVESITAITTCLVIDQFGLTGQGVSACLLTWVLICLSLIDYDHKLLPDDLTLPFLWLGLIVNSFGTFTSLPNAVWGAVLGYLILWVVFWGFKLITGKDGLGYGDFKLLSLLGAWLGWLALPMIILLSSFAGALVGGVLILMGRDRNNPIPFGPYLAAAGWIMLMWSEHIMRWYWHLWTVL